MTMSSSLQRSLAQFGTNIRIARLKRGITAAELATLVGIHRTTYTRVEAGDPMVAMGIYAGVLEMLGLDTAFGDLASPFADREGQILDLQRVPKRARAVRRSLPAPARISRRADRTLRIGILAVMSGPAGIWGEINRRCAEVTADMYNDAGGIDIGGEHFRVEITCADDRLTPSGAAEGARRLIEQEGLRYIIGPNVEQTMSAALPIAERGGAMLFPYSFTRSLYRPPHDNAVLAQVAGYQAVPFVYRHLMQAKGVQTIALIAPGTPEGLRQRQETAQIASSVGLRVLSRNATYGVGSDHLEDAIAPAVAVRPDVLALSNVAPSDAVRLIRRARDLGFKGLITTESAQDVEDLLSTLGSAADGLVMVGGASVPESRSPRMLDFMRRYVERFGTWNDEAGTKAYALEFVLGTLMVAGKLAIDDISRFKAAIPDFAIDNPLATGRGSMAYFGARDFSHKRQIGVPLVVNTIKDGRLQTLFTREAEDILA
jgi:branched-chain amino acid transport system substrate-binding protein